MNKQPAISDAEWQIMNVIWQDQPVTAQEIIRRLDQTQDWTAATIRTFLHPALFATVAAVAVACSPTVKVETPKEPITINLNVTLDANIRVQLEEGAREDIAANPDIF